MWLLEGGTGSERHDRKGYCRLHKVFIMPAEFSKTFEVTYI